MYAIIDVAGQQFKVEKGQKVFVHRLENEEGTNVNFDKVLLIDNDGKITIGEPLIKGAFIEGKILTHEKGDKIIVFKKKRRKGYKVKNGHRQQFSHIEILTLNETGAPKKTAATAKPVVEKTKASAAPKAKVEKTAEVKAEPKKAEKPVASTTAKATTAKKKPAAKKPAATAEKKAPAAKKTAATAEKKVPAAKKTAAKKPAAAKKAPAAKKTEAKPKATPKKKADGDAK